MIYQTFDLHLRAMHEWCFQPDSQFVSAVAFTLERFHQILEPTRAANSAFLCPVRMKIAFALEVFYLKL